MSKGAQTKQFILARTVGLFNKHGFAGVSLSQIMTATGLKKGGIYNHFDSKDQLALEVFDYALQRVRLRFSEGLKGKKTAVERLQAILAILGRYVSDPPVEGGCPVHNAAMDSSYTHPALHARARGGMDELQSYICATIQKGIEREELLPDLNPAAISAIMLSTLEGALMMSKLYEDATYMNQATTHLEEYIVQKLAM